MGELTRRYIVMPMATEGPFDVRDPDATFVLKPWKDPAALRALESYRDLCYPELAEDLNGWIRTIRSGPVVRGGVGARNEEYVAARAKPRAEVRPTPAPDPKPKSTGKPKPKAKAPKPSTKKAKRR